MMILKLIIAQVLVLGAPILLVVYLYCRQAGTGRNKTKIDELNARYASRYHFSFRWPALRAKYLSDTAIDEDEALRIASSYFVENGHFRNDAFRLTIEFVDNSGHHQFNVAGTPDEHLVLVRSNGSFFRPMWDVSKRISIKTNGA